MGAGGSPGPLDDSILHEKISPMMQKYIVFLLLVLNLTPSSIAVIGSKNKGQGLGT